MDTRNPLIPTGSDIAWFGLAVIIVALAVVALVLLARSARRLTAVQALAWTLVILLVPVLGPVAWLSVGRRARPVAGRRGA